MTTVVRVFLRFLAVLLALSSVLSLIIAINGAAQGTLRDYYGSPAGIWGGLVTILIIVCSWPAALGLWRCRRRGRVWATLIFANVALYYLVGYSVLAPAVATSWNVWGRGLFACLFLALLYSPITARELVD